jgi:hypothetical protein
MFKAKQAAAAALMLLCATSVMASNFRVADQIYLPAGGHFAGSRGETWMTDVWISNVSNEPVDISVIYSTGATGTLTEREKYMTLAANERREINDFFFAAQSAGGLGLTAAPLGHLVFNACKAGGSCKLETCPGGSTSGVCEDWRNISVEARVYAIPPGGTAGTTYGQLFPGIPWFNYVSDDASAAGLNRVMITGLRNTGAAFGTPGTFRTNIGLLNASLYSSTQLLVKLFDKNGAQQATYTSPVLAPLGHQQLPIASMFTNYTGANAVGGWITVEQVAIVPTNDAASKGCPNGCPSFLAYGSLIDNGSDDPTTLESQFLVTLSDAALQCIFNLNCKTGPKLRRSVKH